jgi:hypothetical protein
LVGWWIEIGTKCEISLMLIFIYFRGPLSKEQTSTISRLTDCPLLRTLP